jgi:hypothetical protein
MFRTMHETTDDGRRELGSSHTAKVAQGRHVDRAKLVNGRVNARGEGAQHSRDVRCTKVKTFRLNGRELFCWQSVPAGVGEETIDDSGHVSHVKGRGGDPCGAGVPFFLGQRLDDRADTLAHLKKNVRDWLKDCGNTVDRTALPPLSVRHDSALPENAPASHFTIDGFRSASVSNIGTPCALRGTILDVDRG